MNLKAFNRGVCLVGALVGAWATTSSAQEVVRFQVARYNVEGNTVLPQAELDKTLAPFVGAEKDFGDVQQALESLEERYRSLGYSTVSVLLPEQVLERGEVLFKVVEGRIAAVQVEGQEHHDLGNIRGSLPTLKEGEVPFLTDLSASLRIANENPAKKIALQLLPGDRDEDIVAKLKITDEIPWKVGVTLDNTGTVKTGRSRLGLSYQHANLWNLDHILTLQYQTAPEKPRDVNVVALAYRLPLYGLGDAIDFYSTYSDVNAGTLAAGPINLAITGKGTVLGAKYTWNLKRRGDYEHSMNFGFDEKQFKNSILAESLQLGNNLTARPISVQYNGHWAREGEDLSFNFSGARNIPGGRDGDQAAFDKARAGSRKDYSVIRAGVTWAQALPADWQWKFNTSAQWTKEPLIPGEQFGVGGSASVRGFLEREVSSDRGHQQSFELYSHELCAPDLGEQRCRALAFYDQGSVYRVQPLVGEQAHEHISSAGLGLRWSLGNSAFQADYGRVIQPGGSQLRGDWRIHARFAHFF